MVEPAEDQVLQDYEQEVHDPRHCGRVRCCHALLDSRCDPIRSNSAICFVKTCLSSPLSSPHGEHKIPGWFKVCRDWEIFNYIESKCREGRNKNVYKFLIVVKFGLFMDGNDHDDFSDGDESDLEVELEEEEIGSVPVNKSSI
ncbi:hypothetical protein V6N13_109332 [Hibiscus sabdariffa]|uniref:Uncharacterized protein n=1 Tax=Hibiscus sabdariffa TaxID=183260 RepID=A0ABR2FPZ7_9ROSI